MIYYYQWNLLSSFFLTKSCWKELLAPVNLTLAASSEWDQHTLYVKRSTHKKTLKIRDASETAHTVCCKHPSMFIHKNPLLVVTQMYNIPTSTHIKRFFKSNPKLYIIRMAMGIGYELIVASSRRKTKDNRQQKKPPENENNLTTKIQTATAN